MKVSSIVLALLAASSNLVFGVAKKHKNLFDASTSTKKKKPKKPKKPKQDKDDEGPPFSPEIFYIFAGIQALDPVINEHETPIVARFAGYYAATNWNCVAAFSGSYMDSLTKLRPSVTSPDTASHTTKNRAVCLTQATASLSDLFFGGIDAYLAAMEQFEELVIEEEVPTSMKDCLAAVSNSRRNLRLGKRHLSAVDTCLGEIALEANYDPTTMGHVIAVQTYAYALSDGFNMLGNDDGCTSSCRPYSDTSGYSTVNATGRWQPLIDDNGKGFFYEQKFVTPHIGTKAKFRFLPESDRDERIVRAPTYSETRGSEMEAVIAKMATLDDYKKVEIEAFDDKLYTTTQIIGAFVNKLLQDGYDDSELGQDGYILSLERLLHFVQGITAVELDSIIIAWKEKASYDLVRPTSVVKERGDEEITTWALNIGIATFKARDFEAYVRVMPHPEYTSGSSCLFEAVKDYVNAYLTEIGLDPTSFPISFPPVNPGESKVEPGITPSSTITLQYGSIDEMGNAGSQSRFNGGMHFYDSVPAGIELCSGIGNHGVDGTFSLIQSGM